MRAAFVVLAWLALLGACVEPRGWQPGRTADGCYARDNCGLWPPYYSNAEYCGEPKIECPVKRP